MSRHVSPVRQSKHEYAHSLDQQLDELHRRRRDQPKYVAGKVGAREWAPQPPPPRRPVEHHHVAADESPTSVHEVPAQPPGFSPEAESKRRQQRVLAAELERQIAERDTRNRSRVALARQESRERLNPGLSPARRTGRAWVNPTSPSHFSSSSGHEGPVVPQASDPAWMRSGDDVAIPTAAPPQPRKPSPERNAADSPNSNRSPVREGSISGRHISPERLREAEYELRSETKLFDFEKRQAYEAERQRQQERQRIELAEALKQQIEERERKRQEDRKREEMLDLLMEQRARAEAKAMAEREAQTQAQKHATIEEAEAINRDIALRHRRESVGPNMSTRASISMLSPDALRSDHDGADGRPKSESPERSSTKKHHHERHQEALESIARSHDSMFVPRSELQEVLSALHEIKTELARGPPLSEVEPPRMVEPSRTPEPRAPPPQQDPASSSRIHFVQRDTVADEAKSILERNQQRLSALRYADRHDDVLKAFLLQDSTAALRTLSQFHRGSGSSPYPMPSPSTWHPVHASRATPPPYSGTHSPSPQQPRSHTSMR